MILINALKRKVSQLEDRAAGTLVHADIPDWALEYAEQIHAQTIERGNLARQGLYKIISKPCPPDPYTRNEAEVKRLAQKYASTYPNLSACKKGERKKRRAVEQITKPAIEKLKTEHDRLESGYYNQ